MKMPEKQVSWLCSPFEWAESGLSDGGETWGWPIYEILFSWLVGWFFFFSLILSISCLACTGKNIF